MTPQEKELLTTLLDRVKNAPRQDKDPEADALIRQAMTAQPDLPYYLTQTVLIQDLSLHQAQQRITDLEKQLTDAQQAAKPSVGSFLGGLFGNRPPAQASGPAQAGPPQAGPWTRSPQVAAAPPAQPYGQPGYAPQPGYGQQPMGGGLMGGGMGGAGGGFLRSAAATAAGVAGGALLFQGISSLFGNHYAGGLMSGGMTPGLGETVVNNYYGDDAGAAGGGDWSSDPGGAGGGGDWSSDAGADPGQDFSSDQDWGGGGGDWSSGDSNTSC
ncbi:MAG TPA: DUF2076 domain-containing protein [Stellaceae bacterium]|jgi:hypothetical protein|nr:DUF2076 domain-containing protein [Stellaceae bacterium]